MCRVRIKTRYKTFTALQYQQQRSAKSRRKPLTANLLHKIDQVPCYTNPCTTSQGLLCQNRLQSKTQD